MSALKDQINSELKQAMFDKNVFLRDTLRLVTAEIKRFEVDNRVEATDDDLVNILKKMAKQRKDSIIFVILLRKPSFTGPYIQSLLIVH